MPTPVLMPALSPTMEEGTLSKWNVKEGDKVSSGDVIAEIETDKATMEVESVDEGVLGKILVAEGAEEIAVNTPIAVLLEEGEDSSALASFDAGAAGADHGQDQFAGRRCRCAVFRHRYGRHQRGDDGGRDGRSESLP